MAFTDVQIASQALKLIGDNAITSFSDPGNGAATMNEIYEQTYQTVLTETYWRFAMKKATLVLNASPTPLNQYQYKFDLPADFIMMQTVRPSGTDWEIFEQEIYSNQDALDIDYIFQPDESTLPPYFVKLLTYRLAADGALGVTDKQELLASYEAKYDKQLVIARAADSMNRPSTTVVTSPYLDSHLSGNSNEFQFA